ncbi:MAG TPA: aminotransferase class V-fold PLP-dependent enzyme [Gaiellaceae bacterium]|jgi:L-cysteine/cystine lyase|nr:aminotransferase class V-fold PLP-dependent enzyme [Gaiellaceae bacterium]
MTWADERARFPVTERKAYFNAGTFGPLSAATLAAMGELRVWEGENGRGGAAYFQAMLDARDRVRGLLAEQLGVPAGNVALTDSTTQGVHVVVTGLGLGPGDEVVSTDVEHFGLIGPLAAAGTTIRVAPVRGLVGEAIFDAVKAQVTPATRLLALSAISWLDGAVLPWRELQEATGLPVLVDGAQSVGAVPVDATAADFYTVSAQKWLCGPDSTGALYVRDPDALPPRLVGYPAAESYDIAEATWEPKAGAARFDPLFTPATSVAGLEAALSDLPEGRFERARELTERCRELLAAAGHDVRTAPDQGTLVTFAAPGDSAAAAAALYERGVVLRELQGTGTLRASVGWWNDESDLERLVDGLARISA